MKLIPAEIKGIKFYHREGYSDLKTFEEVIGRDIYQKRGNKIGGEEHWIDCGGNVGAFALLACSKGARVTIYEPDPFNCKMIEKNLAVNGYTAVIHQAALVHNEQKSATLYVGNNNQVWRNSLMKNWNGKGIKVPCVNFDAVVPPDVNVKMDIEGLEMPIIESTKRVFKKLIFEWSFDMDPSLERYWRCLEKLKKHYEVKARTYKSTGLTVYPSHWWPQYTNIFCFKRVAE